MKPILLLAAALLLLHAPGCKDEKSIYEDCCGTSPTMDSIWSMGFHDIRQESTEVIAKVLVPNIFIPSPTPTHPNNLFFPLASTWNSSISGGALVLGVRHLICSDNQGDTLFVRHNFQPDYPELGWDGKKSDGTFFYGSFDYEIAVEFFNENQIEVRTYKNRACAFKCHDGGFPHQTLPDCLFPNQNNGNGDWDKTSPYPKECF